MSEQSVHQELTTIRKLMEESRSHICGAGRHWVLWGLVGTLGLGTTYAVLTGVISLPLDLSWIWGILLVAGWGGSVALGRSGGRRAPVRNAITRMVVTLWIGLGVTLTLAALAGMFTSVVSVRALPGLLSVIIGTGFFATGAVLGLEWLRWLAAAWWVGGSAMLVWPGTHTLLVALGMVLALEVLPGLLMERDREPAKPQPADRMP